MKLNINVCVGKENKVSKSTSDPTASLMYSRIKKKNYKTANNNIQILSQLSN